MVNYTNPKSKVQNPKRCQNSRAPEHLIFHIPHPTSHISYLIFFFSLFTFHFSLFTCFSQSLIDCPTTFVIPASSYNVSLRLEPAGGMIGLIGISPFSNFSFGISWGATGVIGTGEPASMGNAAVQARYRLADSPISLAFGIDYQKYLSEPKGVYGVIGGDLQGKVIPYIGGNYHKKGGLFGGIEAGIAEGTSLIAEYSYDWESENHLLGAGLRWEFEDILGLEFDFRDLLEQTDTGINRILKITYTGFL